MWTQDIATFRNASSTATVLLGIGFSAAAAAQEPPDAPKPLPPVQIDSSRLEYRQFDKVEITGSSIVRKEQTQALPVKVITRADIQKSGLVTLTDVVQSLSNVFNGLDLSQTGMNQGAYTSAALHGMPTGTLVLLNGKRLAPYGIQNMTGKERASVDLGLVPLSAVERIEVLSDGASSLYGTDAIAGVINILTRTEFNGAEVSISRTQPKGGVGQATLASLNWGKGQLTRDGYSLRISAEADQNDPLNTASRPFAAQARRSFTQGGQSYEADSIKASPFTSPAWIYSPNTVQNALSGLYENGACSGDNVSYRGLNVACKQNMLNTFDIYPASNSQKLHALGELWLSNEATLYAEFLYGKQQEQLAINDWRAQSGRIVNKLGSVGYAEMVANGMDPSYGFYYWQPNLTALRQKFEKSQQRAVLGLKGEWDQWNYNANLYQSISKATQYNERADYASLGITTTGLSNPLMDPRLLQPLDAQNSLTAQLLNARFWDRQVKGQTTFTAAELRASRSVFEIDGKDVLLGWGLEARHEKINSDFNPNLATPSFNGQRRDFAGYAELQIPVRSDWDVIASIRNDRYSDVGSTIHSKLATRWTLNGSWALRGGVGTGFRAPTIGQVQVAPANFASASTTLAACSDAMNAVMKQLVSKDGFEIRCPSQSTIQIFSNGNADLRPEKSMQSTLGIAFTPTKNLSIAMDYWRVQVRDTLQFESINAVLSDPPKYTASYIIDPTAYSQNYGAINFHYIGLLLKMQNLGATFKEGIDLDARYRLPLDWGRLMLGAQATYVLNAKEKASADANWVSDLAAYSTMTDQVTPRLRARLMFNFEKEAMSLQLNGNYTSAYTDKDVRAFNVGTGKTETVVGHRVPGYLTWDLFGTYQATKSLQWRLGVVNLLDSQPPLSFYSITSAVWGFNSQNGNLTGRTIHLGMTCKF
jgi:iron complex outermembrane receptor protein